MDPLKAEKGLALALIEDALKKLKDESKNTQSFNNDESETKEFKAAIDLKIEGLLVPHLLSTGLGVLSEEMGERYPAKRNGLRWVVDPLDGTVNYIRGSGNSAISISLCQGNTPIWGLIGLYPSGAIVVGDLQNGTYYNGEPISVSQITDRKKAIIFSGFPSRFAFDNAGLDWIHKVYSPFGKVRMVGSAANSLVHLAMGSGDAYAEKNIMLWDVAAGLAIVEGAGGAYWMETGDYLNAVNVVATNGLLTEGRPIEHS